MNHQLKYKCNKCGREGEISKEIYERNQTPFCRGCFSTDIVSKDERGEIWALKREE
jgi:DNA-directed RNA polymerase subunit RPC12/RpoP